MPPFSLQKPTKNAKKLELGRHQFFDGFLHRFFIDFPSIWEANLGLCWPLRRAQDASKRPPRWLPRRSAWHFAILFEFWWILNRFLVDSWSILDWFWLDFWLIFHRFLVRFLVDVLLVFKSNFQRCLISWLDFWSIAPARWRARSFAALWINLSFLSAALDPQEMAQRYWSYEGFMPIFWFGLIIWMCKVLGSYSFLLKFVWEPRNHPQN